MKKASLAPFPGGAFILFLCLVFFINCKRSGQGDKLPGMPVTEELTAEYVGRESCRECHEKEYMLFQGSDHDMAMDTATEETVLGNFNNVRFTHYGITSRFYRADGKFMVHTEGPDGQMADYQVSYVFGIRPLQQLSLIHI